MHICFFTHPLKQIFYRWVKTHRQRCTVPGPIKSGIMKVKWGTALQQSAEKGKKCDGPKSIPIDIIIIESDDEIDEKSVSVKIIEAPLQPRLLAIQLSVHAFEPAEVGSSLRFVFEVPNIVF